MGWVGVGSKVGEGMFVIIGEVIRGWKCTREVRLGGNRLWVDSSRGESKMAAL